MQYVAALILGLFLALLVIVSTGCTFMRPATEQAAIYIHKGGQKYCSISPTLRTEFEGKFLTSELGQWAWIDCSKLGVAPL